MDDTHKNEHSKPEENNASFLRRLNIYQNERFPILGHGLLVAAFSFSAISYSLICRGVDGFVSWSTYLVGIFTTITLFMLVRIFDEFKDAEDDAQYRSHLPVPRGLMRLNELKKIGILLVALQISVNLYFFPRMLILYGLIMIYLLLMGKEFFIGTWLKKHPFWYVTSHMFIIPLIDIYASGLDWLLADSYAPFGLVYFFAVSYMNGIVLEIGRKIRPPADEKPGVQTYTALLGTNKAIYLYIAVLFITLTLSVLASHYAGHSSLATIILVNVFIVCCIPPVLFLIHKTSAWSKKIEVTAALWTIAMYLTLGGAPMLHQILFN
jgi:4-hydroxybenzoate polyprenyltransferase